MTVMGHQSFFETEKSPQTRMNTKKNVPDSKIRHIIWWQRMDSNHRSEDATDLQSAPIGHSGTLPYSINGAGGRIRTPDLLITNQLLYQLSYTSVEIGLPASYPLYAPKRRIMALKYNINSSGLCQAPFLPDGENFYGSAVRAFPLAFFAARL